MLLLLSADFFAGARNTIRVSNGLSPDQGRCSVGPIWVQTVSKAISRRQKLPLAKKELMLPILNLCPGNN